MPAALSGITVLDLTRVLSGPYCTMMLADLGARVLKVEEPRKGDDTRGWGPPFVNGESAYFMSVNRNKESITLDFKHPAGRAILERLLETADVLVENFRPGALAKLGLDYASLFERYPRLVYCSISGFGHSGPRRNEAGYDAVMQAEGGLMSLTGTADGPPTKVGIAIADVATGMFAAQGVTAALYHRERTGRGQFVDIAMLDSVAALLAYQSGIFFANGTPPSRLGNRHPTIVPYETFLASDGEFVVAVGNDDQWQRFCAATGFPADEDLSTNRQRVAAHAELKQRLDTFLVAGTRAHWIGILKTAGVPCGAVRDLQELFADPQLAVRQMVEEVDHPRAGCVKMAGTPLKLSATPAEVRTAPPTHGQHTESVLARDLQFTADEIATLRTRGVI